MKPISADRPDFQNCDACEMPRSCQGVRSCAKKKPPHRPREPQSARGRVEALIAKHGPASINDLAPHAPDLPRQQIQQALLSLCSEGRLVIAERGRKLGYGGGSLPSVYALPDHRVQPQARPMIASVFDLGKHAGV